MVRVGVSGVGLLAALGLGLAAGCAPPGVAVSDVEPAAGGSEPAAEQALSAASVVVADGPPQELRFTSSLNTRQLDLIAQEFQDEIANARGPAQTTAAEFDLNADGVTEVFVMIKSDGWCGSGDVCNIWVYQQAGDRWQPLSSGEDAGSCVSILPTATNGYRDVRLHGQCALEMCTFDLRFTGTAYGWDGNRECEGLFLRP